MRNEDSPYNKSTVICSGPAVELVCCAGGHLRNHSGEGAKDNLEGTHIACRGVRKGELTQC